MPSNSTALPAPRLMKIVGLRLIGRIDTLGAPHLLDHEAQRGIDEALVELRLAHASRQHDFANFAKQTSR